MQESNYKLSAKGCHSGLRLETSAEVNWRCYKLAKKMTIIGLYDPENCTFKSKRIESKICSDFGISQIYYKTAKKYKFDINKLTTDLEYSINAGAQVLAYFKKRFRNRDINWWTRYNCGTRGTTKRDTCQNYKRLVERYL